MQKATAVVTGASRGFGRAIAARLVAERYHVVGVGRHRDGLDAVRERLGPDFTPVVADVSRAGIARDIVACHRPGVVVLNAGASPTLVPFTEQSWTEFSTPWHVDVFQAFEWLTAALQVPLAPGSIVVTVSSGAALRGSPLSGGYAGAKAMVRFLSRYAVEESRRLGLGVRFTSLLPVLAPSTDFGARGAEAYAALEGIDIEEFTGRMEPILQPEAVADTVHRLVGESDLDLAYLLTAAGAAKLD